MHNGMKRSIYLFAITFDYPACFGSIWRDLCWGQGRRGQSDGMSDSTQVSMSKIATLEENRDAKKIEMRPRCQI